MRRPSKLAVAITALVMIVGMGSACNSTTPPPKNVTAVRTVSASKSGEKVVVKSQAQFCLAWYAKDGTRHVWMVRRNVTINLVIPGGGGDLATNVVFSGTSTSGKRVNDKLPLGSYVYPGALYRRVPSPGGETGCRARERTVG